MKKKGEKRWKLSSYLTVLLDRARQYICKDRTEIIKIALFLCESTVPEIASRIGTATGAV